MNERDRSTFFKWLALGCSVVGAGLAVFFSLIVWLVFSPTHKSPAYQEAMRRASADARVAEVLGTPVDADFIVPHSTSRNADGSVNVNLTIPIHGPKSRGSLRVEALWKSDVWTYRKIMVTPKKGAPIDLTPSSTEESPSTAPPTS